jgi:3-deoxy-manno-octulosonate cytidylyltransferase (CMP-KDO synthetase)
VEQHGEIPIKKVYAIIPARYASTRLPGKMLRLIAGEELIVHTMRQAEKARLVSEVIVAADDARIVQAVEAAGGNAVMTSPEHASGSDRLAEVAAGLPEGSVIVNVQGDEPLISPETIDRAVGAMLDGGADIVTVCEPLTSLYGELLNFNVVKAVVAEDGRALYFSRSPMPFPRDASLRYGGDPNRALTEEPELFENFRKHSGLYVYSREFLLNFTRMPQTRLEKLESLEQLRALEDGAIIKVVDAAGESIGVDTQEDLDRVRLKIEFPGVSFRVGTAGDIPSISDAYIRSVRGSYQGILPTDYLDGLTVEKRSKVFADRRAANAESYGLLIAEHESAGVIGFVDFAQRGEADSPHGYIFSFYFVPEFQRRGLGSLLFRDCLRKLRNRSYATVCLDTFETNPSRPFYDKMGGKVVERREHEVNGLNLPAVVYRWDDLSEI